MGQITGAVVAITVVLAAVFVPERAAGRHRRRDLQAVRADDRDGDGVLGVPRARRSRRRCARRSCKPTEHESQQLRVPLVQPRVRLGRATPTSATSAAPCGMRRAGWSLFVAGRGAVRLPVHAPARQLPARKRTRATRSAIVQLPPGATMQRTSAVMDAGARRRSRRTTAVDGMMQIAGFSFVGQGENVGMAFVQPQALGRAQHHRRGVHPARERRAVRRSATRRSSWSTCRPSRGLGQFGGFDMYLQDRSGAGRDALAAGAQHAARQGRGEGHVADRRCARTRWRTRRSSSSTSTACRRSRWACRSATSTTRSS